MSIDAVNQCEEEVAASYNAFLLDHPEVAESTHRHLSHAHEDQGLTIRGRPICTVLRPRFLTSARHEELVRVSEVLARLFERAGTHMLASDRLLHLTGASEEERRLWDIEPGYPDFTLTSRLDSFMLGDRPSFVEYNAESPASIAYCDILSEIFLRLPVMQRWQPAQPLTRFDTRQALLDVLLSAYVTWGGRGKPTVAIVDWADVLTKRDWELCADFFREQGIRTLIADPRAFRHQSGRLTLQGENVDIVYRRVLLHELLAKAGEAEALLHAYRDGAVCMVNSPRSKMLHKKAVFALLSDRTLGLDLSQEEREVVDAAIPWTRILKPGETEYRGKIVDLDALLLNQPDSFALKPNDDYGGRGVVLGWETSEQDWKRALESARESAYVVQERVEVPRAAFPVWKDGRVVIVDLFVDTNPLLFGGKMKGILTRMSGSALLNVSAGTGSTTPTFVMGS